MAPLPTTEDQEDKRRRGETLTSENNSLPPSSHNSESQAAPPSVAGSGGITNFEDNMKSTKSCMHALEQLKSQHEQMVNGLNQSKSVAMEEDTFTNERIKAIVSSKDRIENGLSDAQFMIQVYAYIKQLESERRALTSQVKRLCQENAWLRDELNHAHTKQQDADQSLAQIQVEKQHLEFLLSVKKYDDTAAQPSKGKDSESESETNSAQANADVEDDHLPAGLMGTEEQNSDGSGDPYKFQENVPAKLRTLHNLVIQYASKGRYEVALPLCKQALDDLEQTHGHEHPDVATLLNIMALVMRDQNKFRDAINLLEDALQIREKTLGPDHPSVAATLNNLSVMYGRRGRFAQAEPLCKRALAIREKALGPDHPDVAKQLNNLALLCQNLNKFDEVEEYYTKAWKIYEQNLGPEDSNVHKTKNNLASAYLKQGRLDEAEDLFKQVLNAAFTFNEGSDGDGSQSNANTPYEYGQWHKLTPVDSPTVATTLKYLSSLYRRQQKPEAADVLEDFSSRAKRNNLDGERREQLRNIIATSGQNVPRPLASFPSTPAVSEDNYSSKGDGSMQRSGSLTKLRQSIQKSSNRLFNAFSRSGASPGQPGGVPVSKAPPPSAG